MRRGLVHIGSWTLATTAMVALSWYGVHRVLETTDGATAARNPAGSMSVDDDAARIADPGYPSPPDPATTAPDPSPTGTSGSTGTAELTTAQRSAPEPGPGSDTPGAGLSGSTHTYLVRGGRVVLDLGASSATLVSAAPDAGWTEHVFRQSEGIQVEFTTGGQESFVICSWNGRPPVVRTYTT